MEKTTIKGTWGKTPFTVEIDSTVDGKAVGRFIANVYTSLLERTPSFMGKLRDVMPSIATKLGDIKDQAAKCEKMMGL